MRNIGERDGVAEDTGQRMLELRGSSLNVDSRTINADVTTETPVPMIDWQRMEMVPEILVSDGAILPRSGQVPFLDSHNRSRVSDQIGSARGLEVRDNKLVATLHFSESATNEFTKVREGHVTDVSAGYEILKRVYVPAGESKTLAGRSYTGPANVVTKWRLREVSLTPIGADAQAKLRGLDPAAIRFESEKGKLKMNPELRALLVSRGMKADLTDEQAQVWLVANRNLLGDPPTDPPTDPPADPPTTPDADVDALADKIERAEAIVEARRQAKRAAFNAEADGLCDVAGMPEHKAHCRTLGSRTEVSEFLIAKRAVPVPIPGVIKVGESGFDQLRKDMGTALTLRALANATQSTAAIDRVYPVAERAAGASTFRNASMLDMAKEFIRGAGVETRGLTNDEIAICAMFGPQAAGLRSGTAYHTTGSFSNLTLDAVNKSMQVGYTETPSTWRGPMRQGASVQDFKNIHRMRLGAVPNLPIWNDNSNPEKASIGDAKETYAVESRSLELDFSYRLLINDDMDALSRAPAQLGAAAARTVNAVAWSQVTANGLTSDGVALFSAATGNRKQKNLETGTAPPTTVTLGTLSKNMRLMRGENTPEQNAGQDILNLIPRYLIGPPSLETVIRQLVMSAYDPTASQFMMYNTAGTLIPVIEPLLEADSVTAYYLWADPSQIDTVEVTFLAGQEIPQVRQFVNDRSLSQSFIVLQSFGAKALNHRGMQKHAGA